MALAFSLADHHGSEIAELEDYIAQRRAEFMAGDSDQQHLAKYLFPQLDRAYTSDYSDPSRCTADSTEMARDMLQRVRRIAGQKVQMERQAAEDRP